MTPPLNRTPMAPQPWSSVSPEQHGDQTSLAVGVGHNGRFSGALRRICLLVFVLFQTWLATTSMIAVLPYQGREPLEVAIIVLFVILFGWISAGFWTAMAGFLSLLFGNDRYAISDTVALDVPIADGTRAAIVMPIFNEDVAQVFAGIRATYESLERTGNLKLFDFFVLSDSSRPEICEAEQRAWFQLCQAVSGFGRIYYRRRIHQIKRKSGNIADFCRRWGKNYRYMVVLDADSIMTGTCLTRLVQLMEANPDAGIIQTVPTATGRETLHARLQQFASRMYGPIFAAGLHFWQLGESHYWGHNAIIRIAPFIRHCALRRLPGRGPLSGEILSHDFVEAALMRRAGWRVWLAYDLAGSYEEIPSSLVEELTREKRWCKGNLLNLRVLQVKGLHPAHRTMFIISVMAYFSSALWFLFLVLSTVLLAVHTLTTPEYFVRPFQLFPQWPEWHPTRALTLLGTTALLLFLPKIAAVLLSFKHRPQLFGGAPHVVLSVVIESVLSSLLAPIRMLFHTQFVVEALAGWPIHWKSPRREDAETPWHEAWRRHGGYTLLGTIWAGIVYWLDPVYLWWLLPIVGALIVSIPMSALMSRRSLGLRAKNARIFLIPEELHPPRETLRAQQLLKETRVRESRFDEKTIFALNDKIAGKSASPVTL